ncbi:DUF3306 domain-containing protein [Photobacterium kishitanii]|uniref:DUF3306 domain-containing protein n=1 Tax=Photobacterium kishitanii TaxID=318456 RepID=UPI0015E63B18|nr:DUF3306 domain-containing protein [Photobacterium kishitanii]
MATNFFQRWSNRKLTPGEKTESTITDTEAVDDSIIFESEHIETPENITIDEVTNPNSKHPSSVDSSTIPSSSVAEEPIIELTIDDADKVTYESGVASFMQQQVTKSVKKAALRKLFHSEEFNYISDMDDSTEDFSNMQGLAPEIASQMRGWINTATETATEQLKNDGISALTSTSSPTLDAVDPIAGGSTHSAVTDSKLNTGGDNIVAATTDHSTVTHTAIESNDTEDDLLVNNLEAINPDDDALPTADLSLTPIINGHEHKS